MKTMWLLVVIGVFLLLPAVAQAGGKISYSGIPCKWSCTHETVDDVGPQRDDPIAARQDHALQRRVVNYGFLPGKTSGTACFLKRNDGRLFLLDSLVTQGR